MHVTRLDIAGLRRFDRVELAPAPGLNVLVGGNGAGKTSVLEALHLMAYGRSFRGRVRDGLVGAHAVLRFERELNVINPEEKTSILTARLLELNRIKLEHWEEPAQGMINQTLIINHKYVLRADIFQPDVMPSRYLGEERAYDRLRALGIPVPEIIALDVSRAPPARNPLVPARPARVRTGRGRGPRSPGAGRR